MAERHLDGAIRQPHLPPPGVELTRLNRQAPQVAVWENPANSQAARMCRWDQESHQRLVADPSPLTPACCVRQYWFDNRARVFGMQLPGSKFSGRRSNRRPE